MPLSPDEKHLLELRRKELSKQALQPSEKRSINELRKNNHLFFNLAGNPADLKYSNEVIKARDDFPIHFRIYNSDLPPESPTLIFYPGGSYIIDLFESNAIACSRIAKHSNSKVIIINHRLAPEYPLPTSIYDAYDITKYIIKNRSKFNIQSSNIMIGGFSSGAHCAVAVTNFLHKIDDIKITHQILLNGLYDLTQSHHEFDQYSKKDEIFNRDLLFHVFKLYGLNESEYKNPLYSPIFEKNCKEMPPTTIIVSEYDGLRNDSEAYYQHLKSAGVTVEKILLPGQTHTSFLMQGFLTSKPDPAKTIADVIIQNKK